jgi:hypothetical protein
MKCLGEYDACGERCEECHRFMDDCDGSPDYGYDERGNWVEGGEA